MYKEKFIAKHGEAAYAKKLAENRTWNEAHPEEVKANSDRSSKEQRRKGGKYYEKQLKNQHTGIPGDKNKVRYKHGDLWRKYKKIIAPWSLLHHEWISGTSDYRGVALVEKDQHQHGIVDVIEILEGEITLFTEEEVRRHEEEKNAPMWVPNNFM